MSRILPLLALAFALGLGLALLRPREPTFVLRTQAGEALAPRFAADPAGGLLLSWLETGGEEAELRFAAIGADGPAAPRVAARGRGWFVNFADVPTVLPLGGGRLVAHYLERTADLPFAYAIRLIASADGGRSFGPPFSPHPELPTEFGFVSHFAWPDGSPALVWLDGREMPGGGPMQLRHARHDGAGRVLEERLLDPMVCECCLTAVALAARGPVVVYRGREPGELRDIRAVRWLGERWSSPAPVHPDRWRMPGCPINGPAAVAIGERVAVAWYTGADGTPSLRLAISEDGGAHFAPPRELARGEALLGRVALAAAPDGRLWLLHLLADAEGSAVELLALDPDGSPRARRIVGRAAPGRQGGFPRLAHSPRLGLWAAWTTLAEGRRAVTVARLAPP
ncbi:MAG: hypothetical protein RML12_03955 [Xanthomonadales bacterium]|nr:hypothetical protein [Xanthomonadales bacterium]